MTTDATDLPQEDEYSIDNPYCWLCTAHGHWTRDCPDLAPENRV